MIKKIEESEKKLVSFKKFSELSKKSNQQEEASAELPVMPLSEPPHVPNLPTEKPDKVQMGMNTDYMMPGKGELVENPLNILESKDVEFIGKIAKLPKGVKASKAYNFLENVKVSKSSIWYLMIEKQDNELQMVKYNHKKGVDLNQFIKELKTYYIAKYKSSPSVIKMIENIQVDGNDKYSWIKNIPLVEVDGKKMISKITEDLVRLLSK
jgi:hypothetical protein